MVSIHMGGYGLLVKGSESRDIFIFLQNLAGEEGFEPSHAGIKIQCLNQLGDSPTVTPKKSNCKRDFYLSPQQFDPPILMEDFATFFLGQRASDLGLRQ